MHTVKQISSLAGISVRTLHYYDEIGLLTPEIVGGNKYRYYGEQSILRLQQVLFYRELGLPLEQIKKIIETEEFDALEALRSHREALEKQHHRISRLILTVDDTILYLKGQKSMSQKQLFKAFSEEEQEEYSRQAEQMYNPETVRSSNRKWKYYSKEEKQRILVEGNKVFLDTIAAIPNGAASPEAQACVERWRRHMDYFWTPNLEQLVGLTDLYNTDARFKANFDQMDPRLAEFMGEAVRIYVMSKK
jgi:DNA-binding transcriptional MerR regulator